MTRARAPYMEWAKTRPVPRIDLAGSNLLACSLDDLPGARDALDLSGDAPNGYPPLVEAIAAHAGVEPSRVATAAGCSGANFLVCAAILDAGDGALVEWPGYDPIVGAARMVGANVRFFERRFEEGWSVDPTRIEAACTPRTRLLALSSPHNPSGAVVGEDTFAELGRIADRRSLTILVDEVYLDTLPSARLPSAATRSPRFVATNSLTKAYGLSSLRCGWALGSPETAEAIRRTRDVIDVNSAIPADRLSVIAFEHLPSLRRRAASILAANRRLWADFARSRPELSFVPSPASIVFPRLPQGRDGAWFAARLFERHGVAVAPGTFFGAPEHFRVALGGATEALARGLAAIGTELDSL